MVASKLKVIEGGRRSAGSSSRVMSRAVVRLAIEQSNGRIPSLKDVLDADSSPQRA